jgi:hypothetical protein
MPPEGLDSLIGTKWLNRLCDAHSLWCHIHYKNELFLTSDGNFMKKTKLPRLLALGAGRICNSAHQDSDDPGTLPGNPVQGGNGRSGRSDPVRSPRTPDIGIDPLVGRYDRRIRRPSETASLPLPPPIRA